MEEPFDFRGREAAGAAGQYLSCVTSRPGLTKRLQALVACAS